MLSSRTRRVEMGVMPTLPAAAGPAGADGIGTGMRAQPGQHVVAQRLRLEHHRVGAVPGDVAGELVGAADVRLDHLAVAAAQLPGADGPPGPAQRGRPPVCHPHPGLPAGRRRGHVGDSLGDDPAQVDAVRHGDRAGRADRGDARSDPGQPERAGGVAVAVVAHQIPAALLGDHAPGLDGAGGVRLGPRRPVRKLHGLTGVDGGQQDSEHFFRAAQSGYSGRGGDGDRRPVIQGSTSTPAARSLSSAPWVAVISSGDSHSWVATATAAASSGVRSTGASA